MPAPIIPRESAVDKTRTWQIVQRAEAQVRDRFSRYAKRLSEWVLSLDPPSALISNADRYYFFELDETLLRRLDDELDRLRVDVLMQSDPFTRRHFIEQAALMGYRTGTERAIENLDQQTGGEYQRQVEFVLTSQPYQSRIAYVSSRAYENMSGLTQEMKADIRRTLTDGMAGGRNPVELARLMRKRVGVSASRALRIARTEVTTAHRRAIADEDAAANAMGVSTKLMHVSALIPDRTRLTHAQKHGKLWDNRADLDEWYSVDGNSINCLCTQVSVLVDSDGKPTTGKKLRKKMMSRRKNFVASV